MYRSSYNPKAQYLGGIFNYNTLQRTIDSQLRHVHLPQPFTQLPLNILITFFISSLLKIIIPLTLQNLYRNIRVNNLMEPVGLFLIVIVLHYYFELRAERVIGLHKLKIKQILSDRAIRAQLRKSYQQFNGLIDENNKISCWTKISANINIFVDNYYISIVTIVFEIMKAIIIIIYLFIKLGNVTFVGLAISFCISFFLKFVSNYIQQFNFQRKKLTQRKTNILTQYFSRIMDYQMSWLDGYIGDKIQHIENQYQKNLRKFKMIGTFCVGFWQFTSIGVGSIVLCVYYFLNAQQNISNQESIEPATIIYYFQMLAFPMNAISWNFAGLSSSKRAIFQLSQSQRNGRIDKKHQKRMKKNLKFSFYQTELIEKKLVPNKVYAVYSENGKLFKKLAYYLSQKGQQVGYAQENGFMLPSFLENIYFSTLQQLQNILIRKDVKTILQLMKMVKAQDIPIQNQVHTFSGGQKMRLSLARAFFKGKYIIIDSDLTSLDNTTRQEVLTNIRQYVLKKQGICVIIRAKQNQKLLDYVDEFITVCPKYLRVEHRINQNISSQKQQKNQVIKPYEDTEQQSQKNEVLRQKILIQIAKFQRSLSSISTQKQQQPRESHNEIKPSKWLNKISKLSLKTLKFYYHHKTWHILFIISLFAMYGIGIYFNYFVNVNKPQNPIIYAQKILQIVAYYILFIILRAVLFEIANLKQSQRISNYTNKLLIYNHINFYDKLQIVLHVAGHTMKQKQANYQKIIRQSKQSIQDKQKQNEIDINLNIQQQIQQNIHKNMNTQKLVCLCTSDLITTNDNFQANANILWNNIATVICSLILILIQIPIMIVFIMFFIFFIHKLYNNYKESNQIIINGIKDQQIRFMKSINYIEQGSYYLHIYNKKDKFLQIFKQQLQSILHRSTQQFSLSLWLKSNFRINMIFFLLLSIMLFCITIQDRNNIQKQSSKMGVMVRYILVLADYIFMLIMSYTECRGQAISVERIRKFAENSVVINGSFQRLKRVKAKRQALIQQLTQYKAKKNKQFICLKNFNYSYNKYGKLILQNINLRIKTGDRIILKGKTGAGKTTLFKILMGLYPQVYFPQNSYHLLSFSSQHPLKMGESTIKQKIDPFNILQLVPLQIKHKIMQKYTKLQQKQKQSNKQINYEQQIMINNLRAYLYGFRGLTIYDEPNYIADEQNTTYIVVTHHGKFQYTLKYKLKSGILQLITNQQII